MSLAGLALAEPVAQVLSGHGVTGLRVAYLGVRSDRRRTYETVRVRGAQTGEPHSKAAAEIEFARCVGALLDLQRVALCVTTLS